MFSSYLNDMTTRNIRYKIKYPIMHSCSYVMFIIALYIWACVIACTVNVWCECAHAGICGVCLFVCEVLWGWAAVV